MENVVRGFKRFINQFTTQDFVNETKSTHVSSVVCARRRIAHISRIPVDNHRSRFCERHCRYQFVALYGTVFWITGCLNRRQEYRAGCTRKETSIESVVRCDRWCDGDYMQPYTTMYDEEDRLFKMWARSGSDSSSGYIGGNAGYMYYYTSKDGVHWDKPNLGVIEVDGRRDHNIVFTSDMVVSSPSKYSYGPERFIAPTTAVTPQGKKAFFWSVNKHPSPRDISEKYVALAIVQDHGQRGTHCHISGRNSLVMCEDTFLADTTRCIVEG